ncbi:MAG: hypothetical protein M1817_005165 [Caeruleum heppii]|nr:MAG: hypothetical protein M1817_005165 [Caeruleum heppii]
MDVHSFFFGHLLAVKSVVDRLPHDAHPFLVFGQISRRFTGVYYIDMWPFGYPFLIVTSVTAATQATQQTRLAYNRPPELQDWFHSITGGPNLFSMPESEWKVWRAVFSPGFSSQSITQLVPHIVEETLSYRDVLREHARENDLFQLDTTTLRFTIDLIGRVIFESRLQSQNDHNPLASALLSQIHWKRSDQDFNPWQRWHPLRPFVQWYNGRQMDTYIGRELDKRYALYRSGSCHAGSKQEKSVIDLALQGYMEGRSTKPAEALNPTFRAFAISQIRLFLFVGHDTTSSTICYIYHLLSSSPQCLARLRAEHDEVLGDLSATACLIEDQPHLLNQLPYTVAVIKEAMRLFPPASSVRQGVDGIDVTDDSGNIYPTGGTMIWILHQEMQRSPMYWKQPNDFIPDRWLAGPQDPLYPIKGAWRPFEHGPRNCIGQGLIMLELRITLVLTIREFDIRGAYEEWDRHHHNKGIKTVEGERAYQIERGGAHPADRFPCRVSFRT